jgi:predicted secreted Zn-dependent protease
VQKREHARQSYLWLLNPILVVVSLTGCSNVSPNTSTEIHGCPSEGEISVSTHYIPYEIAGSTPDELRAQMDRLGPTDDLGRHWDAYTKWDVSWSYPYSTTTDGCATGPIKAELEITFVFPQWNEPEHASELVERWDAYLTALQRHEDGHKGIALAAGCEILQALETLPSYTSCSELEQRADTIAENLLEYYRQQEDTYDQETDHGATQGVHFP